MAGIPRRLKKPILGYESKAIPFLAAVVAGTYFLLILSERIVVAHLGFWLMRSGLFVAGELLWNTVFVLKVLLAFLVTLIGLGILRIHPSSVKMGLLYGLFVGVIASVLSSLIGIAYMYISSLNAPTFMRPFYGKSAWAVIVYIASSIFLYAERPILIGSSLAGALSPKLKNPTRGPSKNIEFIHRRQQVIRFLWQQQDQIRENEPLTRSSR